MIGEEEASLTGRRTRPTDEDLSACIFQSPCDQRRGSYNPTQVPHNNLLAFAQNSVIP